MSLKIPKKFLITSQLLLNLDVGYFFKGGVWATLQQVVGVTSGLIVSYLFGHFVSKTVFGEYNLILSFLGMLTFLSLPGMDFALTQSTSRGYDKSFLLSQKLKFKFSLTGTPVLLIIALYYVSRNQLSVAQGIISAAMLFPFLNSFTNYPAFLTAKKKFKLLAFLSSLSSMLFLLFISIGIFIAHTTFGLITAYMLALSLPSIINFWYSKHFVDLSSKYGYFLTLLSILPWISGNLGGVILANILGADALAIYAVANRFLTSVQKNFMVFYKPVTAKLAEQNPKQHLDTLKHHGVKLLMIGILLAFVLFISTPLLIHFFFTERYTEAIKYGQVLSLALIPLPFTWVVSDMMIYQKLKKPQILISSVSQVVKIVLFLFLIPKWQINGLIFVVLLERFTDPVIPFLSIFSASRRI